MLTLYDCGYLNIDSLVIDTARCDIDIELSAPRVDISIGVNAILIVLKVWITGYVVGKLQ